MALRSDHEVAALDLREDLVAGGTVAVASEVHDGVHRIAQLTRSAVGVPLGTTPIEANCPIGAVPATVAVLDASEHESTVSEIVQVIAEFAEPTRAVNV
jgi:hypothetical protein